MDLPGALSRVKELLNFFAVLVAIGVMLKHISAGKYGKDERRTQRTEYFEVNPDVQTHALSDIEVYRSQSERKNNPCVRQASPGKIGEVDFVAEKLLQRTALFPPQAYK